MRANESSRLAQIWIRLRSLETPLPRYARESSENADLSPRTFSGGIRAEGTRDREWGYGGAPNFISASGR